MSLISGFNVTPSEVATLAQASLAAFSGGAIPSGWTVVTPQQLGIAPQYRDGIYFTNNGASAIVLQNGGEWIVSFRGTDSRADIEQYPQLISGNYIDHFQPLLAAVAAGAPAGTHFSFTGASLGGAAANELADKGLTTGAFAGAHYVAFESPVITNANGILNIGFENDPIYRALNGYGNSASSLDHIVLAKPEYMAGNYDGQHPFDAYAHVAAAGANALARIEASAFFNVMTPDSVVIVDASPGLVQDITPGREATGAFYIGQSASDLIAGRDGPDHIEGFAGDDILLGNSGADVLLGGTGNDSLNGGTGADDMRGGPGNDTYVVDSPNDRVDELNGSGSGIDTVVSSVTFNLAGAAAQGGIENLTLRGTANINGFGNALNNSIVGDDGANHLVGWSGSDLLNGGLGNDMLTGGQGNDTYVVNSTSDRVDELTDAGSGIDTVASSVTFNLAGAAVLGGVENLVLQGAANVNGFGNALNNSIIGNGGANQLVGWSGNDTLNGRLGNDTLTGGQGHDTFFFNTTPNGTTNRDIIRDFSPVDDTIALSHAVFSGIVGLGTLSAAQFVADATGVAHDANDHVIYETDTGWVSYDSNGSAAGGAVHFALLAPHLALTNSDFLLV